MRIILNDEYRLLKEGKLGEDVFIKKARLLHPKLIKNSATIEETVNILKGRNILNEGYVDLQPIDMSMGRSKENFENAFEAFLKEQNELQEFENEQELINYLMRVQGFNEEEAEIFAHDYSTKYVYPATTKEIEIELKRTLNEAKAVEKKTTKEVTDVQDNANFDFKNQDDANNHSFQEILKGIYAEGNEEKNQDKSFEEIKKLVVKNLTKDPMYYTKNSAFGIMGIGYENSSDEIEAGKNDQMKEVPKKNLNESKLNEIEIEQEDRYSHELVGAHVILNNGKGATILEKLVEDRFLAEYDDGGEIKIFGTDIKEITSYRLPDESPIKEYSEEDIEKDKQTVLRVFRDHFGATDEQVQELINKIESQPDFEPMQWTAGIEEYFTDFKDVLGLDDETFIKNDDLYTSKDNPNFKKARKDFDRSINEGWEEDANEISIDMFGKTYDELTPEEQKLVDYELELLNTDPAGGMGLSSHLEEQIKVNSMMDLLEGNTMQKNFSLAVSKAQQQAKKEGKTKHVNQISKEEFEISDTSTDSTVASFDEEGKILKMMWMSLKENNGQEFIFAEARRIVSQFQNGELSYQEAANELKSYIKLFEKSREEEGPDSGMFGNTYTEIIADYKKALKMVVNDWTKDNLNKMEKSPDNINEFWDELDRDAAEFEKSQQNNEFEGLVFFNRDEAETKAAMISEKEGVVVHVNEIDTFPIKFELSSFYDSDTTVASYENGTKLNENKTQMNENKDPYKTFKTFLLKESLKENDKIGVYHDWSGKSVEFKADGENVWRKGVVVSNDENGYFIIDEPSTGNQHDLIHISQIRLSPTPVKENVWEDTYFPIFSKYVEDPDQVDQFLTAFDEAGLEALPDWLVANLTRDEDFMRYNHEEGPGDYDSEISENKPLSEAKSPKMSKYLKEIDKAGDKVALEAKINAIDELIEKCNSKLHTIDETEGLEELVDKKAIKALQKEIKLLEKQKEKYNKMYEKMTGNKKKEVIDEDPVNEATDEDIEKQKELTAAIEDTTKAAEEYEETMSETDGEYSENNPPEELAWEMKEKLENSVDMVSNYEEAVEMYLTLHPEHEEYRVFLNSLAASMFE